MSHFIFIHIKVCEIILSGTDTFIVKYYKIR